MHKGDEVNFLIGETIRGAKWTGLRTLLRNWDGWREYDYVMLADDDVLLSQDNVSRFFANCHALGSKLAQPALTPESPSSHLLVYSNSSFRYRATSFVEIMAPCFASDVLADLLWTLDLSETGWGWGLDHLWPSLIEFEGVFIQDCIQMVHTMPVGRSRNKELQAKVIREADQIFKKFGISPHYSTIGGHDGKSFIDFSEPRLLNLLIKGYDKIFENRPSLLYNLLKDQFAWQPKSSKTKNREYGLR